MNSLGLSIASLGVLAAMVSYPPFVGQDLA